MKTNMKIALLSMTLVCSTASASTISATSAAECEKSEAQFIGFVVEKGISEELSCYVRLGQFTYFNSNVNMPLDSNKAQSLPIKDEKCSLKLGEEVSGILVLNSDCSAKID